MLVAATLLSCVLIPSLGHVRADEPIANDFWGSVYADGNNAPNGIPVRAEVDGAVYGSGSTLNIGLATTYLMSTEGIISTFPKYLGNLRTEVFIQVKLHDGDLVKG